MTLATLPHAKQIDLILTASPEALKAAELLLAEAKAETR